MCQITVSLLIQLFLTSNTVMIVFLDILLKIICKSFINRTEKLYTELLFSEKSSRGNMVFLHCISCLAQFHDGMQQWLGFTHIVSMNTSDAMDEVFLILGFTSCSSKVLKALFHH